MNHPYLVQHGAPHGSFGRFYHGLCVRPYQDSPGGVLAAGEGGSKRLTFPDLLVIRLSILYSCKEHQNKCLDPHCVEVKVT